jgi:uncharacterized protein
MSRQVEVGLPKVIDSLAFAKAGDTVSGYFELASMPRLAEVLAEQQGRLACLVSGSRDADGNSWMKLEVSGCLDLVCQRCLKRIAFPVDVRSRLLLVPNGQSWPDEELAEDGYDAVAAEKEMELSSLIEDEVLLALPIAPMHGECEASIPLIEEELEPSPFAVLAKLKKGV